MYKTIHNYILQTSSKSIKQLENFTNSSFLHTKQIRFLQQTKKAEKETYFECDFSKERIHRDKLWVIAYS